MCCPTWSVVTTFHIIKFSLRLNFLPSLSNFNYLACLSHTPKAQENPGKAEPCEHLLVCCKGLSSCSSLLGTCTCAAGVTSVAQADAVIGSLGFKFLARTEWNKLSLLFSCSIPGDVSGESFSALHICYGTEFQGSDLGWVDHHDPWVLCSCVSVPAVSTAFLSCWGVMKVSPTPRKL